MTCGTLWRRCGGSWMQIDADLAEPVSVEHGSDAGLSGLGTGMTPAGRAAKHVVDFVIALLGVICLSPVLVLVACAIKIDSPGPVFFRQQRAGRRGKLFAIFKFRTMVHGAYQMGSRLTVKRDPRITRLGKFLRW